MAGLMRLLAHTVVWLLIAGVRRLSLPPSFLRRDTEEDQEQDGVLLTQNPQCSRCVGEQDTIRGMWRT